MSDKLRQLVLVDNTNFLEILLIPLTIVQLSIESFSIHEASFISSFFGILTLNVRGTTFIPEANKVSL